MSEKPRTVSGCLPLGTSTQLQGKNRGLTGTLQRGKQDNAAMMMLNQVKLREEMGHTRNLALLKWKERKANPESTRGVPKTREVESVPLVFPECYYYDHDTLNRHVMDELLQTRSRHTVVGTIGYTDALMIEEQAKGTCRVDDFNAESKGKTVQQIEPRMQELSSNVAYQVCRFGHCVHSGSAFGVLDDSTVSHGCSNCKGNSCQSDSFSFKDSFTNFTRRRVPSERREFARLIPDKKYIPIEQLPLNPSVDEKDSWLRHMFRVPEDQVDTWSRLQVYYLRKGQPDLNNGEEIQEKSLSEPTVKLSNGAEIIQLVEDKEIRNDVSCTTATNLLVHGTCPFKISNCTCICTYGPISDLALEKLHIHTKQRMNFAHDSAAPSRSEVHFEQDIWKCKSLTDVFANLCHTVSVRKIGNQTEELYYKTLMASSEGSTTVVSGTVDAVISASETFRSAKVLFGFAPSEAAPEYASLMQ